MTIKKRKLASFWENISSENHWRKAQKICETTHQKSQWVYSSKMQSDKQKNEILIMQLMQTIIMKQQQQLVDKPLFSWSIPQQIVFQLL